MKGHRVQVGGTLDPERAVYITRPEDDQLMQLLMAGEYACLLAPRQVGKSSLMVRTALQLRDEGWRIAVVDLSTFGRKIDLRSYFFTLTEILADQLGIDFEPSTFWDDERSYSSDSQQFARFFHQIVLHQLNSNVIICLDEVDSILRFDYSDDLFLAIRAIYNERTLKDRGNRLVFCLVGVATVSELVKDKRTTPFNIGTVMDLSDFSKNRDNLTPLKELFGRDLCQGDQLIERVFYWTDGHPFLTMTLFNEMLLRNRRQPDEVDTIVVEKYLSHKTYDKEANVENVERIIKNRVAHPADVLTIYLRLLSGRHLRFQATEDCSGLRISGLVKVSDDGLLVVRNRIFQKLFDEEWTERMLREIDGKKIIGGETSQFLHLVITVFVKIGEMVIWNLRKLLG